MNENAQAQALSDALDALLRGQESAAALEQDPEVRDLADLGRSLSALAPEPSEAHNARIERLLLAHRADLARAVAPARGARRRASVWDGLRAWAARLTPSQMPLALAGVAVAAVVLLVGLAIWGPDPFAPGGAPTGTVVADLPTATVALPPTSTPEPPSTARPTRAQPTAPGATSTALPVPTATSTATPTEVPPYAVVLGDVQGIVQVRNADGAWSDVLPGGYVLAGQRVRTGALSGVTMSFYDGSVVELGPDAQLSIERLAPALDGSRVIELVQWLGEAEHDVAEAAGLGARYTVRTPSGTGAAVGTRFYVRVSPTLIATFGVREGAVEVSNLDVSVVAVAGQVTAVRIGAVPDKPSFRISGEGQVTETGAVWRIAGQPFAIDDATAFVGRARPGDWVAVEGRLDAGGVRVADRIVLLHHTRISRFWITGEVQEIEDDAWRIAGRSIAVSEGTDVQPGVVVGDVVHVDGAIGGDGTLAAHSILLVGAATGEVLSFAGVLQERDGDAWTVSDIAVGVDDRTVLDEGLLPGEVVAVRGEVRADGARWGLAIKRVGVGEHRFEFVGAIDALEPAWAVAGIPFETRMWTEAEPGLAVGDRALVEGLILDDGTWVADEIRLAGDRGPAFGFTGQVDQLGPEWVIGRVPVLADEETEVTGDPDEGDLVQVEGQVTDVGDLVAREIDVVAAAQRGAGCVEITSVVLKATARSILLPGGVEIALDEGAIIEGKLQPGAVVVLSVCVDSSGQASVVSITVVHRVDPDTLEVSPGDVGAPPPSVPPDKQERVLLCHKPGTPAQEELLVAPEAVPGHLAHGDTLGPCPPEEEKPKPNPKPTQADKDKEK
ncbi:MAG: FecR domain-containing protein [Anaerolineae bacterium]|nr:FecR domain-containing protein [Anaerolineae bacterium]